MKKIKEENLTGYAKSATDYYGNTYCYNCMGCDFVNKKISPVNGFIYESDNFFVLQDIEIPIKGFLVINAKRHINSYIELNEQEKKELGRLLEIVIKSIKDLNIAEKVTLVQEERSKHFHIWVVPNEKSLVEKFGSGIENLKAIFEYKINNITDNEKEEIKQTVELFRKYINQEMTKSDNK